MRILLDENIPVQLKGILLGHDVRSVNDPKLGWKNVTNGVLLAKMDGVFDLLITADRNIYAQQNLVGRSFSILVLPMNKRNIILSMSSSIVNVIDGIRPNEYAILEKDGHLSKRSMT